MNAENTAEAFYNTYINVCDKNGLSQLTRAAWAEDANSVVNPSTTERTLTVLRLRLLPS
jgi:hypothetical protein